MKLKEQMVFLIFLIFAVFSYAEDWEHIYYPLDLKPGFILDKVIPFSGGGYVGVGYYCKDESCDEVLLYVGRMDSHGNILWAKKFLKETDCWGPPLNIIDNNDETFTITKVSFSSLIKFDKNGNVIFEKSYNDIEHCCTIKANNGDLYSVIESSYNTMALLRIRNSDGEYVFNKFFKWGENFDFMEYYGRDMVLTSDNKIVIVGVGRPNIGAVIVKTDENGEVLWTRRCQSIYDPYGYGSINLVKLLATNDDGVLLFAVEEGMTFLPNVIIKLDKNGNMIWQEKLILSYDSRSEAIDLIDAAQGDDGSIIITGSRNDGNIVTIKLNQDGKAISGTVIYVPYYSLTFASDILKGSEGYVFISHGPFGFSCYDWMGVAGGIGTLNKDGKPTNICYDSTSIEVSTEETSLAFSNFESNSYDGCQIYTEAFDVSLQDVSGNLLMLSCGELWPGITTVEKKTNPLRLKLTGWNFEKGSKVLINGKKVGSVEYKGKDKTNRTKIVVSGSNLKKALPKGEEVCIKVVNPDGNESDCFYFTR